MANRISRFLVQRNLTLTGSIRGIIESWSTLQILSNKLWNGKANGNFACLDEMQDAAPSVSDKYYINPGSVPLKFPAEYPISAMARSAVHAVGYFITGMAAHAK